MIKVEEYLNLDRSIWLLFPNYTSVLVDGEYRSCNIMFKVAEFAAQSETLDEMREVLNKFGIQAGRAGDLVGFFLETPWERYLIYSTLNVSPRFSAILQEGGSSATTSLEVDSEGHSTVVKRSSNDGIDGNGRPWLLKQTQFYELQKTLRSELTIAPKRTYFEGESLVVEYDYYSDTSFAAMLLYDPRPDLILDIFRRVVIANLEGYWRPSLSCLSSEVFLNMHFSRAHRRISILKSLGFEFADILSHKFVFDGEVYPSIMFLLEDARTIALQKLSESIPVVFGHGDLNAYNILIERSTRGAFRLIDPRGVNLYSGGHGYEKIDPVYDLAKLKFSLSGFIEIRANLATVKRIGKGEYISNTSQRGEIGDSMRVLDSMFLSELRDLVPASILGEDYEMRLALAEAINFVADAPCAIGRNKGSEVAPLLLFGARKLFEFCCNWR